MNEFERVGRHIVRTFYDPLPTLDSNAPIWCLGQQYDLKHTPPASNPSSGLSLPKADSSASHVDRTSGHEEDSWIRTSLEESERKESPNGEDPSQYGGWPHPFLDDFESRIWMTYRSGFAPIQKSQDPKATAAMSFRVRMQNLAQSAFSSDAGFGCMIRSGQCILANALLSLKLGRDWRLGDSTPEKNHHSILSLFADDPKAPFSIHRFVEHGAAVCGKYPGEWFGPSATARCIQDLVNAHKSVGLRVYVSGDGADVYEEKLKAVAIDEDGKFQPTLILVGTRLGIDKITPVYWEAVKASLQMPQSIGIAGGRPSASHYFVGTQGNMFFYLDPHSTRPLLPYHTDPSAYTAEDVATCHTRRLRRIEIREMDPSMLIAFLVHDENDFEHWKEGMVSVQGKAIVHVSKSEPLSRGQAPRESAIDEVESFDERDEDEGDTVF
ncbi:autophagy-related protein-like protein 4 [Lindgomyces ingoldianus]|uniref:Autophagy-related protein-like protein 4 n=1 Tax=Lindgomyces ingoldianus TaxID=673940 RepID=A0ACB6QJY6_9PLEO|nr:autophagy-related protein-like protein 4 [Lindgomyces ingoldianus]KAF2466825.1 autophagy-related protein-like protein 4 [Lindgomyces ingoldianus]